MSNSSLATEWVPAYTGNYNKTRRGHAIKAITIHHMAGKLTAKRCGELFQAVGRNGSSHYGVGYDGGIAQYVDEADTAWTNSNATSNAESVTIETSNDPYGGPDWKVNDVTLNALIKLVADIAKRNNLGKLVKGQNLTWHSMFTATTCPGPYLLSKFDYIAEQANKINGYGSDTNTETTTTQVGMSYQVYTTKWYPNVTGHSTSDSNNGYAGVLKNNITAVKANATVGNVYYRVHTKGGKWLSEVKNRDDYAGIYGKAIDGFMIKSDSTTLHYQVHTVSKGWLSAVTGYNTEDSKNGYAGILGQEIDAIMIWADPIVKTVVVDKPKAEEPKVEATKVETPKVETPKVEEPKVETPKIEEPKVEEVPVVEEPKTQTPEVSEVETPEVIKPTPEVENPPIVEDVVVTPEVDAKEEEVVTPPIVDNTVEEQKEKKNGFIDIIVLLIKKIIEAIKSI